jgi:outer membrane lipoprotein SlyB
VAEVLGVVGGAVMGNDIQRKYDPPVPAQRIIVRMSNGVLVSVTQPETLPLSVGQRVYIEGHGEAARVIPR